MVDRFFVSNLNRDGELSQHKIELRIISEKNIERTNHDLNSKLPSILVIWGKYMLISILKLKINIISELFKFLSEVSLV